jgi:hypothetical protein
MNEYEMYLSGMSIPDVSKKTGIPLSTLRFRFKREGILRSRADGVRFASKDGKLSHMKGKKRFFSEKWKANISKGKTGKGVGRSIKTNGYVEITMGENKGRLEHVIVMEKSIGRRLYSFECVHHKDKCKTNNSIDNLELMTKSEHARLHALENNNNRNRDEKGRYL